MTGIARRTAYRILRRFGAHRLRELFPVERPRRGVFTAREPGEVVQIDIRTLGRLTGLPRHSPIGAGRPGRTHRGVTGYQHVHVAVDAASRRTYLEVRGGLGAVDCAAFLRNAVAAFDVLGISVQRVLTDNGTGYKRTFAEACAAAGVRWTRTKPYHPWTNGRAERFIRTLQRECLYETHLSSDDERRYGDCRRFGRVDCVVGRAGGERVNWAGTTSNRRLTAGLLRRLLPAAGEPTTFELTTALTFADFAAACADRAGWLSDWLSTERVGVF